MSEPKSAASSDKDEHPKHKQINGQTAVRFDSTYPNWPGCVYVPEDLTPQQFMAWWELSEAPKTKEPGSFRMYRDRYDLILEWHIEGLPEKPDRDPLKLPSACITTIVREATQSALVHSQVLPN